MSKRWPYSAQLPFYPAPEVRREYGEPLRAEWPASVPSAQEYARETRKPWSPTIGELTRWGNTLTLPGIVPPAPLATPIEIIRLEPALPVPQTIRVTIWVRLQSNDAGPGELTFVTNTLVGSTLLTREDVLTGIATGGPLEANLLFPAQIAFVQVQNTSGPPNFPSLVVTAIAGLEAPLPVGW